MAQDPALSYVVEFIIRLVLVYTLPISQFLAISPFIFYGITIAVIAFTIGYGRRLRRRADEMLGGQQETAAVESGTTDATHR